MKKFAIVCLFPFLVGSARWGLTVVDELAFSLFDNDSNGKLDFSELYPQFSIVGHTELVDLIDEFDMNDDRKISRFEFHDFFESVQDISKLDHTPGLTSFGLFDTNGDGFLDLSELKQNVGIPYYVDMSRLFNEADTNDDGKISRAEYQGFLDNVSAVLGEDWSAGLEAGFKLQDTNENGFLELSELEKNLGIPGYANMSRLVDEVDTNNDGKISRAEYIAFNDNVRAILANGFWTAALEEEFNKLDKNKDGFIELSELEGKFKIPDNISMSDLKITYDTNLDNKLTRAEFKGFYKKVLQL